MELTNDFVIERDVEETWRILTDLEFIAPCMPGAQLTEVEGEEYRGLIKIKVGPVTANYKGRAWFIEQDSETKTAKLQAEGRDPRQGNAQALITALMEPAGHNQAKVTIHTDLGVSGKIASLGKGAVQDVSKKLLSQFTENLREKLEATPDLSAAASDGPGAAAAAAGGADSAGDVNGATMTEINGASAPASTDAEPTTRKIEGPEAEPVDVLAVSRGAMAKRLLPVGAAALALAYLVLRRRRS
jgi:carbon monoxide dehydrogenase subunit G